MASCQLMPYPKTETKPFNLMQNKIIEQELSSKSMLEKLFLAKKKKKKIILYLNWYKINKIQECPKKDGFVSK